jgi:hypothetical protein
VRRMALPSLWRIAAVRPIGCTPPPLHCALARLAATNPTAVLGSGPESASDSPIDAARMEPGKGSVTRPPLSLMSRRGTPRGTTGGSSLPPRKIAEPSVAWTFETPQGQCRDDSDAPVTGADAELDSEREGGYVCSGMYKIVPTPMGCSRLTREASSGRLPAHTRASCRKR